MLVQLSLLLTVIEGTGRSILSYYTLELKRTTLKHTPELLRLYGLPPLYTLRQNPGKVRVNHEKPS